VSGSLTGGSIRILWNASDSCDVTITGTGPMVFTVGGAAVTFPYRLSASTTFDTALSGTYTVSVKHHGHEIANTPDGTRTAVLERGAQLVFAPSPDDVATGDFLSDLASVFEKRTKATGYATYLYGNSYSTLAAPWFTTGKHYAQLAAEALGGGTVTSYGVSGRRIIDICSTLVNGAGIFGVNNVIAAGKWTSTTARPGLVVLEGIGNDIGHYPDMTAAVANPTQITSANTRYLDGIKGMWRTAIAVASSESRIEQTSATFAGTWSNTSSAAAYASGGSIATSSTAGASATFTVTPAQSGPLAGKVYVVIYKLDPGSGTMATLNVSVDGGAATSVPVNTWEQYLGHNSANTIAAWDCIPVTVPVDGASHTVAVSHAGTTGQWFYLDCVLVPSIDPNPIAVPAMSLPPNVGVFNQTQINAWRYNTPLVENVVKGVVNEFPNAFWVPTTMTANALWSGDGLHLNDRGMQQRCNDLLWALRTNAGARLLSRELSTAPDSAFGIV
jgi:hypothetical protein